MEDCRTSVLQGGVVRQKGVDGNFGGYSDVTQGAVAVLPFRDVKQPLRAAHILKQVGHLLRERRNNIISFIK